MLWMRSDGANRAQVVFQNDRNRQFPFSFTSDQKRLAFMEAENDNSSKYHVWTVPVQTDANGLHFGKPEPFFHTTAADERHPAFSPDGRWLAYTSNETGMRQIWVRAFPGSPSSGRWQISKSGGSYPLWSRQGRRLFFRTEEEQVMVADWTTAGDSFGVDSLRAWSETLLGDIGPQSNFDIAPDGKRIIGILPAGRPRHHVVFLLNFFDDLRRRVPVVR
jgi:serine/threonine-protein kinase